MTDYVLAHSFCSNNREQLAKSTICGCCYCGKLFSPAEITNWLQEKAGTAICPHCGVDAVIGDSSGFSITDAFLKEMNRHWFG